MRIAVVSDVHIGNHKRFGGKLEGGINARCCLVLTALDEALALAKKQKCKVFFVTGDFLDYVKMEPQIIALLQKTFKSAGMDIVLVLGDHEIVSTDPGDHALGPLSPVANIIEEPTVMRLSNVEIGCIPFLVGNSERLLQNAVHKLFGKSLKSDRARMLMFHAGITHPGTPRWLRGIPDSILLTTVKSLVETYNIDCVVAGNFHYHERWKHNHAEIYQIGALAPTGFDNPGIDGYGKVLVYDPDEYAGKLHTVSGPRFVKADIDDDDVIEAAKKYLGPVYLQMITEPDRVTEAQGYRMELTDEKAVSEVEIVTNKVSAEAAARKAARAANDTTTLEEALAAFIDKMVVDEGVDKKRLYRITKQYLEKGK